MRLGEYKGNTCQLVWLTSNLENFIKQAKSHNIGKYHGGCMKQLYKDYLFNKHILVSEGSVKDADESAAALYLLDVGSNIIVKSGLDLANASVVDYIYRQQNTIEMKAPEPFYIGFPDSVLKLTSVDKLFDQLHSYMVTYGNGNFEEPVHSVLEEISEREKFNEDFPRIEFSIITTSEAKKEIVNAVNAMLSSTRPVKDSDLAIINDALDDFCGVDINNCNSKQTAVEMIVNYGRLEFTKFLKMSDVVRLVDEINFRHYVNRDIRHLNLKNSDRKLITKVIDTLSQNESFDLPYCFEKKSELCGILHHIHYKPNTKLMRSFVNLIRGDRNYSYMSGFEALMKTGKCDEAAKYLIDRKGQSAFLRNLDYIMSRSTNDQKAKVASMIQSDNVMLLIQLLMHYSNCDVSENVPRRFMFSKHNMMTSHTETHEEMRKRKSKPDKFTVYALQCCIKQELRDALKNRLGKVYIDDSFANMAVPINTSVSSSGFGTLTPGSRIHIDAENKKIRAFTYWDHVDDVDLSVMAIKESGDISEFSWRTSYMNNTEAIVFSGDETSGYHGGSEYFDIDISKVKNCMPDAKYLVFVNNVFSDIAFKDFNCKAGYMLRDINDSGEVYEPKTVQSSFKIDCNGLMAYLFAIDLTNSDLVWLNLPMNNGYSVGAYADINEVSKYFNYTRTFNQRDLFTYMASEVVKSPDEADVVVSDDRKYIDSDDKPVIRSYDTEKIIVLMQGTKNTEGEQNGE